MKTAIHPQTWMTVVYNRDLTIVDIINPQHDMLLGMSPNSFIGNNVSQIESIASGDNKNPADIIMSNVQQVSKEGKGSYFEYATTNGDSLVYSVCYAEPIKEGGVYVHVFRIEEENMDKARKGFATHLLSSAVNNVAVGIIIRLFNGEGAGEYILFNDISKLFYQSEDVTKSRFWDQEEQDILDKDTMMYDEPLRVESEFVNKDGDSRYVVFHKQKMKANDNGCYIITTIIDVTKRRRGEKMVEQQFALLESMYNNIPIGISIYDKYGTLIKINKRYLDILGIEEDDILKGKNINEDSEIPDLIKDSISLSNNAECQIEYNFDNVQSHLFKSKKSGVANLSLKLVVLPRIDESIGAFLLLCEDITEKLKMEREINEYKDNLEIALSAGAMSSWIYNIDKQVFTVIQGTPIINDNSTYEEFYNLLDKDNCSDLVSKFHDILSGIKVKDNAYFAVKAYDGSHIYCHTYLRGVKKDGRMISIIGLTQNVSDSYARQLKLEEDNLKNNLINRYCNIIQWEINLNNGMIVTNIYDSKSPNKSLSCEEWLHLIHPDDVDRAKDLVTTIRTRSLDSFSFEVKMRFRPTDKYSSVIINAIGIKNNRGELIKYTGIHRDMSKWVEINEMLNGIINRVPASIFVKDISEGCKYIKANECYCNTINLKVSEIVGKSDYDIYPSDIAEKYHDSDMLLINGEKSVTYDIMMNVDGKELFWKTSKSILYGSDGKSYIVGVATDITNLQQINNQLAVANQKALESDKLKSAFLANMSHEIRTPLNSIIGFSELLSETDDSEQKKEYMRIINTNNDILLHLVGDILDLSKIESGMIDLEREEGDISLFFGELAKSLKLRLTNKDVEYIIENPYKSCIVQYDKNRFSQVVTNYVMNAIKNTTHGSIRVGYTIENNGIKVYVVDTGRGIPANKQDKLFKRFEKIDNFSSGTGLGLSIVKALTELYSGKVGFKSEEGKGSTFWSWIPCTEIKFVNNNDESKMIDISSPSNCKSRVTNILIAEDNDSNYLLLQFLLRDYQLNRAINGVEAVEEAAKKSYDLILMDIKMPLMDGIEATCKIREFNKDVPIIAVTANAFSSDKEKAINAGCNNFLTKPINKNELYQMINEL